MNTLIKMFSLCLCVGALVFAGPDVKLNDDTNKLEPISIENRTGDVVKASNTDFIDAGKFHLEAAHPNHQSSDRDVCDESFVVYGSEESVGLCWSDGSAYYYFYWEGGCLATTLTYSGGEMDIAAYGFTEGFYFYGFEPGWVEELIIMTFDDGTAGVAENAATDCATCEELGLEECWDGSCVSDLADCPEEGDCGDGFVIDCVDTDCCPESWIGDGYEDCEDQAYGCDLTCYDNDGGDCGDATDGGTTGGTTGGDCDDGFVQDCVDDDCCPESWIGDGFEDCEDQAYGCDLTCYDNDGGDCDGSGTTGGTDGGDCAAGTVEDCDGSGECWGESWVGDGLCDGEDQAWGANLCCYDNDGGDCTDAECSNCEDDGLVSCWDGSCAETEADCPEAPDLVTPAICVEGTELYDAPAVTVTWDIETVCGDGICSGDEDYYNCPEDCNAPGECDDGFVPDCVDDDCCPESWIGDGYEDCEDQAYGCDLTCYDNDGGDCDGSGTTGGTTGGGSEECEDCVNDFTAYGSECCDTAWYEYGIDCATLESDYNWDCTGCGCPGDGPAECGDGNCTGDEDYYSCPEDCNAPGECDDGFVPDCVDDDCCPESWIGDGFEDCEDQAYGCDLTCYDNDGGDCGGRADSGNLVKKIATPKSIVNVVPAKKGSAYTPTNAAPFHGEYNNTSDRLIMYNLTFECLEGTNAGYVNTWQADPAFGEFTVYGWGADDFICVTAQAVDGAAQADSVGPVCVMAGAMDGVQECTEGGDACEGTIPGDATLDGEVNVLDIVNMVNHILESSLITEECSLGAADFTGDGEVNVLDIVQVVNVILEGRITGDASSAVLKNTNGYMTIDADGYIGGVQMTLSHDSDFSIEMTDKALVADYNTMGNITKLVVVAPESDELFSSSGNFTIDDVIVANSSSEVSVGLPSSIELVGAYPNPFNPSTTLSLRVDGNSAVTIMAYDISGRMVDVVFDGAVGAGISNITWNASSLPSGVYFVKVNTPDGSASMQKVMLMK